MPKLTKKEKRDFMFNYYRKKRNWVKIADGTYVDKTSRNERFKRIRQAKKEAEKILQLVQDQAKER